jgi:hypothetical protein
MHRAVVAEVEKLGDDVIHNALREISDEYPDRHS